MKTALSLAMITLACLSFATTADAGCVKGAIVGGVAGHLAGHGAVGAAAGCAISSHSDSKKQKQQNAANQGQQPPK